MDDEELRHRHCQRHRREIAHYVVRQLLVQAHVQREHPAAGEIYRVAVWRGLGDELGCENTRGARAILYDHLLAERFGQLLRDHAPEEIRGTACGKGDHEPDRFAWICGRLREGSRCADVGTYGADQCKNASHNCSSKTCRKKSWARDSASANTTRSKCARFQSQRAALALTALFAPPSMCRSMKRAARRR